MLKSRFLTVCTTIFMLYGISVQAQNEIVNVNDDLGDAIVIEGDRLELHLDRQMRSIGNASIHRGGQDVFGDVIEYDVQNDELHVVGNARIELGDAKLTGPKLRMRLSESIGEMSNASITIKKLAVPSSLVGDSTASNETFSTSAITNNNIFATNNEDDKDMQVFSRGTSSSQARGDAKAIFFEGQEKKRLKDARFTTCEVGVDDWYIKAGELELNDYSDTGTAKNAYIEFKGLPILYTPYLGFSFNNQRKSGFLAPTVGSTSRSGFEAILPYYLNISPNMDATIGTRALSKRGLQFQGEFRYLEDNFSGISNIEYLPNDTLAGNDRYYANFKHQHILGSGWSAGYSLESVSDNQYFSELSTRIVTTSRINLPQQFNLSYADDVWDFQAIAQKFQTLDDVSFPYERLPEMTLVGNKYFGNLNTNLYTQLVSFDRNSSAPIAATGTRFTTYPSMSYTFGQPYGYVTPKIGVHHTSYNLNNVPNNLTSQSRTLPIASIDTGLFFDRDFQVANRKYLQTFEPRLFYLYIPGKSQADIPIFDTSLVDLNFASLFAENQFTGNDRINDANQVSAALTTRLIDAETGVQRLSASIGQRYFLSDQKVILPNAQVRDNNTSDLLAGFSANLRNNWNLDALWQYNTDNSESVRTTLSGRYNPEPGKTLNLSYSYRKAVANQLNPNLNQFSGFGNRLNAGINQFNIAGQWPLTRGWYGVGRVNYSLEDNQLIEALAGLEYNAGCWSTRTVVQRVTTATARANTALFFQLELGGLASIGANPMAVIQRNIPGYVSSSLVPDATQAAYYE